MIQMNILIDLSIMLAFIVVVIAAIYFSVLFIDTWFNKHDNYIYIAGRISFEDDPDACRQKFEKAADNLREQNYNPITPFDVVPETVSDDPDKWGVAMLHCLRAINSAYCLGIYMLPDWEESQGATMEHDFAKRIGRMIMYDKELLKN